MKSNLFISGNVQGVGCRSHVKRAAHQCHIRGFVRNLNDGRVEVFAVYDSPEQLEAFVKGLDRKSTSFIGMHVERIDVHREGKPGFLDYSNSISTKDFQIRF